MEENSQGIEPDPQGNVDETEMATANEQSNRDTRKHNDISLSDEESINIKRRKTITESIQTPSPDTSPFKGMKDAQVSSPKTLIIAQKVPRALTKEISQNHNDSSINTQNLILCIENTEESKNYLNIAKISLSTIVNRIFDVIDPKDIGDKRLNKQKQWATIEVKNKESTKIKTKKFLTELKSNTEKGEPTYITASVAVRWRVRVLKRSAIGVVRGVPEEEDLRELEAYCRAENNGILTVKKVGKNTISLKFDGPLPETVTLPLRGWTNVYEVEPYIMGPRQCLNCFSFGHPKGVTCPNDIVCIICGEEGHKGVVCTNSSPKCPLCEGNHGPKDRECPIIIEKNREKTQKINESRSNIAKLDPPKNAWVERQQRQQAEAGDQAEELKEDLGNALEINIKQLEEKITNNIEAFIKKKLNGIEQSFTEKIDKRLENMEQLLTTSKAQTSSYQELERSMTEKMDKRFHTLECLITASRAPSNPNLGDAGEFERSLTAKMNQRLDSFEKMLSTQISTAGLPHQINDKVSESITVAINSAMERAFSSFDLNPGTPKPQEPFS